MEHMNRMNRSKSEVVCLQLDVRGFHREGFTPSAGAAGSGRVRLVHADPDEVFDTVTYRSCLPLTDRLRWLAVGIAPPGLGAWLRSTHWNTARGHPSLRPDLEALATLP